VADGRGRADRPGRPDDLSDASRRAVGRRVSGTPIDPPGDDLPGLVLYRQGRYELLESDALDPEAVDRLAPQGVAYTPYASEAVAAVDRGDAEAAFLLRPTRIEDVWEIAGRGEVMPQKSTFFYPKLTSGLLFLPL